MGCTVITFNDPEGATPLDPNEVEGLLLPHITLRGELDRWEQDNILEALAWLSKTKPKDILTEAFITTLHRRMFGHVWKWAGHFRHSDKNIGGPWHQVPMSVRNLCDDTRLWIKLQDDPSDQIAARFHHRLVSIHPFANGNGRHARLMTDLLLENVLQCPSFTWGGASLSNSGAARKAYIAALRAADTNDFAPLLDFVRQ
jgi:Fic-DOC domain mobile mystery protein B